VKSVTSVVRGLAVALLVLAEFVSVGYAQDQKVAGTPFTLTWSEGRCFGCKNAAALGEIQFVSRNEAWAVGFKTVLNEVNTIVVHSTDAGRTWKEAPKTQQYTDPDGQLAFSFLDASRGWVAPWQNRGGEPEMIRTQDGGQHWQRVSQQFLQSMQFIDDAHGYGTLADEFFRTDDGGRSWVGTKIPAIGFIDRMIFLASGNGWIAGAPWIGGRPGTEFRVFRTANGGMDWEESRTIPPQPPERVRDLFFFDQQRGWLTLWNYNLEGPGLYSTIDGGKRWTPDPAPSFQGKGKQVDVVRFISRERGFVFLSSSGQSRLAYTTDGGTHWHEQALPRSVYDCQVFAGDLICSASPGFRLLTLHPR